MTRMLRTARALVVALAAGLLLAGCTQVVPGQPSAAAGAARIAAAPVADADVAPTAVAALQEYWRAQFPAAFGRPWRDISRFLPVHAGDRRVPCVPSAADVEGQAFYCPSADAVVWDADGLIPEVLRADGPTGVLVVLAHEVGHAVQSRLGIDALQARQPSRYPTILLEAMADCSAGVALAHFAQKPPPGLALGADERDRAMSALIAFKDPLGVEPGDSGAHGNAFDRVSAFQDGYDGAATTCAEMTITNRAFTQRAFGSRADAARRGNLPVDELLDRRRRRRAGGFRPVRGGRGAARVAGRLRCAPPRAGARSPRRARRRGVRRTTRWWSTGRPSPDWRTGSAISRAPRSSPAATGSPRSQRCAGRPPAPRRSAWRAPTPAAS